MSGALCRTRTPTAANRPPMDLGLDIQLSDIAIRFAIATVCALAGITLLWLDRQSAPTLTARPNPHQSTLAPVAPRAVSPADAPGPVMTSAAAYDRLRARIAEAGSRTQRMISCQQGAARQLDTAEVALRRLMDEISGVMPVTISPTLMPRRHAAVVTASEAPALAAAAA